MEHPGSSLSSDSDSPHSAPPQDDDTLAVNPPYMAEPQSTGWRQRLPRLTVILLATWMILVSGLILLISLGNPVMRGVMGMAWGLIILWIGIGGSLMRLGKERWRRWSRRVPGPWYLRFVLSCTLFALLEEAVTTSMTNAAPLFGLHVGQAYITASANYLDVVLYHSVVVFIPMFIGWALLLSRWRFTPFAVFILFGISGTLAETLSFGLQNMGNFPFWIFVYGLMVWLPASAVTENIRARPPRWWLYPIAVIFPMLCVPLAAVTAPWIWLTPKHPPIHFPPITVN